MTYTKRVQALTPAPYCARPGQLYVQSVIWWSADLDLNATYEWVELDHGYAI